MRRLWEEMDGAAMKHSEMMALAGLIFFARAIPKWVAALISIFLCALSACLTATGN
jgi:hypothetical protein